MLFNESEKSIVLKQWYFTPMLLMQDQWLELRPSLVELTLIEFPVSLLEYITKEQAARKRRAITDIKGLLKTASICGKLEFDTLLVCSSPGTDYVNLDQMRNIWLGR